MRFLCFLGGFEKNIAHEVEGLEEALAFFVAVHLCAAFDWALRVFQELWILLPTHLPPRSDYRCPLLHRGPKYAWRGCLPRH